jgi:hypothetical protein
MRTTAFLLGTILLASTASAEPTFLAKQYTRCTACHYSPTGGGLLTPYGRLLSTRELSTSGATGKGPAPEAADASRGEQAFLFGALGDALGPVHLGLELRPSHLAIGFPGGHQDMSLLMSLDLTAAVQKNGWTVYGSAGREPPNSAVRNGRVLPGAAFISYEHWVSYQSDKGFGIRAGRFLPAYGVQLPDHTAYTRMYLGLDRNDQVYGLEISDAIGSSLVQVTVSPGKAEAILHDRTRRGFSAAGRWQFDLAPRATIVGSAAFHHSTDADPQSGAAGGAFGLAPTAHVTIWTEADAVLQTKGSGGHAWVVLNETSVEVYRGIWLKFSPQLRTAAGAGRASDLRRVAVAADLLPRTHWNVDLSYYHDHAFHASTSAFLAQLHLYM